MFWQFIVNRKLPFCAGVASRSVSGITERPSVLEKWSPFVVIRNAGFLKNKQKYPTVIYLPA